MTPPNAAGDPTNGEGSERARQADEQRERLGVTLFSIGDAVIATDARGQITLLNPVAESLTGWTEHDARNLPIESVFRVVNEMTRELVTQPVMKVIELGIIQNLPQCTILIAKDGSELPIDDSAAPIGETLSSGVSPRLSRGAPGKPGTPSQIAGTISAMTRASE